MKNKPAQPKKARKKSFIERVDDSINGYMEYQTARRAMRRNPPPRRSGAEMVGFKDSEHEA